MILFSSVEQEWCFLYNMLRGVLAGGTKGLGKALAREFLTHSDAVVISGRTQEALTHTISQVRSELQGYGHQDMPRLFGVVCDVTDPTQVAGLAGRRLHTLFKALPCKHATLFCVNCAIQFMAL
jgi:chlorophyll(ide) b reductase